MNDTTATGHSATRPPITVGDVTIDRAMIAREAQHHPAASPGESMQRAAEALVIRELLLQEARRRDLTPDVATDEKGRRETVDEAMIRGLVDSAIVSPSPTEDEIARYYAANRKRFRSPDLFEASHVLIAASREDAPEYAAARAKAETIAADLASMPENFATIARVFSDCPSATDGGHLGQTAAADVTPAFAAAVERMAEGETTDRPVETAYGFHLIRLHRRIAGKTLPLELVADRIAAYLTERSRRTATAQFMARLVSSADISGLEMAGAEQHRVF